MAKTTDKDIREKLIVSGAGALTDTELLAAVIREGTERLSSTQLAEAILGEFGGSISQLAQAPISHIRQAGGCGTLRAVAIAAAAEFARRITGEKADTVNTIVTKNDVVRLFAPLADLPHEEFWAVYVTSGGRIIDKTKLSQGGVSGTVVDHKLIVKRAIELLASSLIIVHNHPSGVARPSRNDIALTEIVTTAAALFDIKVVDHIIISSTGAYSFMENGKMPAKI